MRHIAFIAALLIGVAPHLASAQVRGGSLRDLGEATLPEPEAPPPAPGELVAAPGEDGWSQKIDFAARDSRSATEVGVTFEATSPSEVWTLGAIASTLDFESGGDAQFVGAYVAAVVDDTGRWTHDVNLEAGRTTGIENGVAAFLASRWLFAKGANGSETSLGSELGLAQVDPDTGASDSDTFAALSLQHRTGRWVFTLRHAFENDLGGAQWRLAIKRGNFAVAVAERESYGVVWTVGF